MLRCPIASYVLDVGYPSEISKIRNFSGWQKKYTKSENDR
jgi:hypothetical protein